jgi:multidrug resistance protein
MTQHHDPERQPLLRHPPCQAPAFEKGDAEDPRQWPKRRKLLNVFLIALMALLSPLASSAFMPAIADMARDLKTSEQNVIGATTTYAIALGVGPLILAPCSELFGRRKLYLSCFSLFAIMQIPTALSPNIACLLVCRTLAGLFGSVGMANGGGSLNDMYVPSERATVFGWYLVGPLLGPTIGPTFGGIIAQKLGWRWIFGILSIVCGINTTLALFFLRESYAPTILERRQRETSAREGSEFKPADRRPFRTKLALSISRPMRILATQPIVQVMSLFQAVLMATTYSLFTNMEDIFGGVYGFSQSQIGLVYCFSGIGSLTAVLFFVPRIDTMFNYLTKRNDGVSKPEFRLPLTGVGVVLVPASLLALGWFIEYRVHWLPTALTLFFLGLGNICVFNPIQVGHAYGLAKADHLVRTTISTHSMRMRRQPSPRGL